ncbi:DUF6090 family protein [Winogradskyella sp.]|uniref:DUF6090 family protein n=1 Tax=Winogradskyella sp. TaxID=1883156 RepID=UPI001B27CD50|nr:DUF6090 family protein [Winogradskyella sp.]MBO6881380.1 hypothetical protein [Winogradskyella sp.]
MIKFFRHIRQSMINQNRTKKYLLYAIGEIILVVIGILIALQINNWNENRKLVKAEIKALKELQEGFKAETLDLNINIEALTKASRSGTIILKQLKSDAPYHDSLSLHFASALQLTRLISNDGPYDMLKTKGLDLISNDSLRKKIINMHDNRYESLRIWEKGFFVSDRYIQEQCIELFDVVQFFDLSHEGIIDARMVPHDYEALKTNKRYQTMIRTYATQSRLFLMYTMSIKAKLKAIINDINNELKALSQ